MALWLVAFVSNALFFQAENAALRTQAPLNVATRKEVPVESPVQIPVPPPPQLPEEMATMFNQKFFCQSCCLEDCLKSKKQDRSQYDSPECAGLCDGENPPWGWRDLPKPWL
mmetsp:Transcript_17867/g.28130  ORF Transcript_17867/g.28130 Transcript_17867/m.28130 type:complete len:112 (-) Transcript_17867:40-375(-)